MSQMANGRGMPGLRGMEHVGFTVPDLEAAVRFFVDVIGCEEFYRVGPMHGPDGWMTRQLNVHADAVVKQLVFLRCGHGSNFELFEYESPDQNPVLPKNSDIGGHHLAFYVDDFDAALAWLRANDVRILGEPTVRREGPSAGQTWVYFLSPWGMQLELVCYPQGKGYERDTDRRLWHPAAPSA